MTEVVVKADCPKCGLTVEVSINLLNNLWNEGSQLTLRCKKCNAFFRGGYY